jgi:predicted nucleic acid-binding protein
VVDASALVEMLLGTSRGRNARIVAAQHANNLNLPDFAMVEALSALRSAEARGQITSAKATAALAALARFPARRWRPDPLLLRAWELRKALAAYDAVYAALAETLGFDLLTSDLRLAKGAGASSRITVLTV